MPTVQQQPKTMFTHVKLGVPRGTCYRTDALDLMARAGYSKTHARQKMREGHVWNDWTPLGVGDSALLDFLDSLKDWAIIVQPKPGLPGWHKGSRVIVAEARALTRVERFRLWLIKRFFREADEGLWGNFAAWLLPYPDVVVKT